MRGKDEHAAAAFARALSLRSGDAQALICRGRALVALAEGEPEAAVARELGVDRMTVRKWAGK